MKANQKLVDNNGIEVPLFPLTILRMTQDEGGDFSHAGSYNIDFVGSTLSAPLYAPCTLRIRRIVADGSNGLILDSVNPVHLPNGQITQITLSVAHDNNPPSMQVGKVFNQGELFYHTGTAGFVTGDHTHICVGQGAGGDLVQRPTGNWDLSNRIHMWEGLWVNDTDIIQGYGHDWKVFEGGDTPTEETKKKKDKFPWVVAWKHWH